MKNFIPAICLVFILFLQCSNYPVNTSDKDLVELVRVWQYMKVFSIYQDRIVSEKEALTYDNPETLVLSIYDTLYHHVDKGTYYYGVYQPMRSLDEPIYACKVSDNITYIYIPAFGKLTAVEIMALSDDLANNSKVLLDLRWNGGGYVSVCTTIVNMFIKPDKNYLVVDQRKEPQYTGDTGTLNNKMWSSKLLPDTRWQNKELIVLVNPYSASASEILAVALHDAAEVTLVGDTTFGKAIGQFVFHFVSSGAHLQLTGMRFRRIDGSSYQEKGLPPDIVHKANDTVILPNGDKRYFADANGSQLRRALSELGMDSVSAVTSTRYNDILSYHSGKARSNIGQINPSESGAVFNINPSNLPNPLF